MICRRLLKRIVEILFIIHTINLFYILEYSDVVYEIASDEAAKKKVIQVALRTIFRLRKEKPDKGLKVKIATIDELKQSGFKDWFEVKKR